MKKITSQLLPLSAVLAAAAIGGSAGLYIKNISYSGFVLTAFRLFMPVFVLLPVMIAKKLFSIPAGLGKRIWAPGIINVIRTLFFVLAYKFTEIANAVVLFFLWPVFALIISYIVRKEKPALAEIGIIITAFAGVVIMNLHRGFSFASRDLLGTIFMMLAALLYAVMVLLFKSVVREAGSIRTIFFQNLPGAVVYLPFIIAAFPAPGARDIILTVTYGIMIGLIEFFLFFFALKRLPVFEYSAMCYMEVVFGIIFGILVLGEHPTWNMYIGAGTIVAASLLAQIRKREKPAGPAEQIS
ncbi:MAG: DMT family transporter [Spirochaetales bacterium]|nr:DMT family transporter [Spirochaetales bacterium]